jgi:hypothetical protein
MKIQDLYHGAPANELLGILKDGAMKPSNGEICFVKQESQFHTCFVHGADRTRGAAFVIKARVYIPDDLTLKPDPRKGNIDTWILQTDKPVKVEALKLFVRHKPGTPLEIVEGRDSITAYLRPQAFHVPLK